MVSVLFLKPHEEIANITKQTKMNKLCLHANGITAVLDHLIVETPPTSTRYHGVMENQRGSTIPFRVKMYREETLQPCSKASYVAC